MKIKRSSWHYRLMRFFGLYEYRNMNLCQYFWKLTLNIFFIVLFVGLIMAVITSIVMSPYTYHVLVLLFCVVGILVLLSITINWLRGKNSNRPLDTKTTNILTEYIKAKKDKLCPIIEYVD